MTILEEMETATRKHFMPVIQNQIWLRSPVLYRIFKPAREGQWGLALPSFDGRQIVEPLEYGKVATVSGSHGAYAKTDTWVADEQTVLGGAAFDWKMYHVSIKFHNLDKEINKGGRSRIFDLLAVKLRSATKILRDDLITDFFKTTQDGADEMVGLQGMIAASGIVGGINKGTKDWWRGTIDNVGGDPDFAMLNEGFYATKRYGEGDRATMIITTDGVLQKYEDLITTVKLGTSGVASALRFVAQAAGPKVLDGGFESFFFKRIPLIADPNCPAEKLFFINEKYIHWRILKNFDSTGWEQLSSQGKDWAQNTILGYGALTISCAKKFRQVNSVNET